MIQLFNVCKIYNNLHPALVDVSLRIKKGDFIFVTGPSGAGKTTLIKILFRWENYDKGQVLVNGINIGRLKLKHLYKLRRNMGVVFQDYKLLSHKTVYENVALAQEIIEADPKTIHFNTWEALKNVGLTKKKDDYPLQLSGGEQQRVAIARALVNSPQILLADEPTGNLDTEMGQEILELFEKANQKGMTVIFATHSQEILRNNKHPIVTLKRGKIVNNQIPV